MKKTLEQINAVTAAINTEVLAQLHAVPTRTIEAPAMCACCARTEVPEQGDLCYSCEDLMDISDEERYDSEQEEMENLSWLAEMEEELSNEPTPAATEEELEEMYDFFSCLRAPSAPEENTTPLDGGLAVTDEPDLTFEMRFYNVSVSLEEQQHELAEYERKLMYLHVHGRDSLDYHEAVADTVAEIESYKELIAELEEARREYKPEYFVR